MPFSSKSQNNFDGLSIAEARAWYQQSPTVMLRSSQDDKRFFKIQSPFWDRATNTVDSNYYIVELPVKFNQSPGVIFSNETESPNPEKANDEVRLLILKDKQTETMRSALMHIVSNNGIQDNTTTYASRNNHFTGFIFFTNLNGSFINGWKYEKGKITGKSGRSTEIKEISKRNTAQHAISYISDPDNCTVEVKWYDRTCTIYSDATKDCTPWEYMYSEYRNYCGGGGGSGDGYIEHDETAVAPTSKDVKIQIADHPFALLFDVPCDSIKKWLSIATYQPSDAIIAKLNTVYSETTVPGTAYDQPTMTFDDVARVQNINDAYSSVVNMDYFSVKVNTLPVVNGVRLTADQFLHYIRVNIDNFVNTDISNFTPYKFGSTDDTNLWNSNSPTGAIVSIDIFLNDGSVITSYSSNDKWTFTTIHDPLNGEHPVSGNRNFGYTTNPDGSYTFYTQGVDRLTDWITDLANSKP